MPETSLQQNQNLSLQTTITPQMQQSLQILQAPALELRQLIGQELVENPVLEDEYEETSLEEQGLENDDFDDDFAQEFEELSRLDDEWKDYLVQSQKVRPRTSEDEERHAFLLDSITAPITLQEHLLTQVGLTTLDDGTRQAAELLIGMIDDRGFLTSSLEEISFTERLPIEPLEDALSTIQSFHPIGVGAVDLRDCLLIQLERLGKVPSLEERLVSQYLDDLAKKRFPMLAKKLGVTIEQISRAAEFIGSLNPQPGQMFRQDRNTYVEPDVTVTKDEDEWVVTLNNHHIPQLRISNAYKDLMAEAQNGADVRKYIREKIRSGKFLIRSIYQRQETIEKIAREIIRHQGDFLEHGPAHLRPLNMAQVAGTIGVHETTVSRAVNGKYMATPQGLFELKYFFTTGYHTQAGEELSNTSVKNALAALVKDEPADKPYSDQEIVEKLNDQGIPIARRTVAKYRKELNILPSNMRRRF